MKTAISIPDELFARAEKLAQRLGTSRSQLYAEAVDSYIELHRSDKITTLLNEIYGGEISQLNASLRSVQRAILQKENW